MDRYFVKGFTAKFGKGISLLLAAAVVLTSLSIGFGVVNVKAAGPWTITLVSNSPNNNGVLAVNDGEPLTQLPLAKFIEGVNNAQPWITPKTYVEGKSFGVFQGWYLDNITYQQPINRSYVPTGDMVLYGKWHYNIITFDAGGGTAVKAITAPWNTQVYQPADPTKAGSTFVGWYSEDTLVNIVTWPVTLVSDTRVYAKWNAGGNSVITFVPNGGPAVSPVIAETNSSVSEPAAPSRTNYTFMGWYSDPGLTSPVSWPYTLTADVTFYAKWTGVTSTVTFDAQGGSVSPGSSTVTYGSTYDAGTGGFPTPTLSGYFFRGWYTEPGGAGTLIQSSTVVAISGPQTLYAKWSEHASDVYFVQFVGNGNTGGSTASCVCTINATSDLTPNGFIRTGYRWLGWAYNPAATTPDFSGDSISVYNMTTVPNEVKTLYAVWEIRSYDISFDARNGSPTTPTNMQYGSPLTAPTVTRTGYTFLRWSPEVPATVPATHEIYYAVWAANTYTVVYDGNGATGGSTASTTFTYDDGERPLRLNGYTKTGYVFTGWATSPGGAVVYTWQSMVRNLTSNPGGVVTLYAVWALGVYNITFEANGGTGGTSAPMTYGDPLTAPAVTRTGYTFDSWLPSVPSTVGPDDAMYAAQWTPNEYTVVYDGNGSDGGSTASTVHTYDAYKVLAFNGYTKTGYNFVCWNTAPDGSGTVYQPAQNVLNLAAGGTITLYAQWSISTHYVIFCPNGGSGNAIMQGITYGQSAYLLANTYTRTGYTFVDWNTEQNGSGTAWADEAYYGAINEPNEWLYAQWSAHTYTITYDDNGGEAGSTEDSSHIYGTAKNLTVNGYTKEGYSFSGWNTAADGSGTTYIDSQSVENLTPVNGATVTLYVQWTMIPADFSALNAAVNTEYTTALISSFPVLAGDGTDMGSVFAYGDAADRQAVTDAYAAAVALQATAPIADTAANRAEIAAKAASLSDAIDVLLENPNAAVYTYVNAEIAESDIINLNRYTKASLDELQDAVDAVVTGKNAVDQAAVNTYAAGIYRERTGSSALAAYQDTRAPKLDVYETTGTMLASGLTVSGFNPENFGDISYVYPGKAYYTYYCYTNSENPAILVNIADFADSSGRISYPTNMDISKVSGIVNEEWMSYTYDGGVRAGTVSAGSIILDNDRYSGYTIGMGYDPLGEDYYRQAGYLVLKPEFVQAGGKQFAKYTISGKDDAAAAGNLANTTALAGGNALYQEGVAITTTNQDVTPLDTITIFVEYRNAMSLDGGIWYDDGRAADSLKAWNNLLDEDEWVGTDYLYRISGGASNFEMIGLNDAVYPSNDPDYGKDGLACFYYFLDDSSDADVIADYAANGQYSAARLMMADIGANPVGYELQNWPAGAAFIHAFNPQTACKLVYVHLVDRWGNVFNKIIRINNIDPLNPSFSGITYGTTTLNESGGSGVALVKLYEYAFEGGPQFVVPCYSDKLITELNVINEPDNILDISVGHPTTADGTQNRFTLYAKDKAGREVTQTVYTDAAGNLSITVNDPENMGGGKSANAAAANAAGSMYTFMLNDTITVHLNRVPVTLGVQNGSSAEIDQTGHFIFGLAPGITQEVFENTYINCGGDGRLEYVLPGSGSFGTGTKVNVIDNITEAVVNTYTIVIFGDVNGDANIDSIDAGIVVDVENYMIDWDPVEHAALKKAADVNGDGNTDSIDAGIMVDFENYMTTINQITGLANN